MGVHLVADHGAVKPPESSESSEREGALNLRPQDIRLSAEVDPSQPRSEPLPVDLAMAEADADEPEEHGSGDCDRFSDG